MGRYANLICKKSDLDISIRAGDISDDKLEKLMNIVSHPSKDVIPKWFFNNQKEYKQGTYSQVTTSHLDSLKRETLERIKSIRLHRGIRHERGFKVRGQHTKSTGRGRNS